MSKNESWSFNEEAYILEFEKGPKSIHAFLYNFDVNSSILKIQHKTWLDRNVINNILIQNREMHEYWNAILIGSTSTTGEGEKNLILSKKRAEQVRDYIQDQIGGTGTNFDLHWVGEYVQAMLGLPDDLENLEDRAVQIYLKIVSSRLPPPPKPPPQKHSPPCCFFKLEIEYLKTAKEGWQRISGSPKFHDGGQGRTSGIDRDTFISSLRSRGWSDKRAWELFESGPYTRANLEDTRRMPAIIDRAIEAAKESMKNCSSSDPTDGCSRSTFSKK